MKTVVRSLLFMAIGVWLVSCASPPSAQYYSRSQIQRQLSVFYGTVLVVEPVHIEGTQTGLGTLGGAVLGGIAGNAVGGGHGRALATVAGVVGGALVGAAVEQGATQANGLEITVELDSGEVIAVVQEADDVYQVGDRVRIVRGPGGMTRVRQ
ncbi:MAG: glycine zipper 2TM domain-containing protein [Desulfuromonadaceae bacterium]|nr:glycine zipper 2TM domain-containing protein [Desulfuromonadaceae bacterium]